MMTSKARRCDLPRRREEGYLVSHVEGGKHMWHQGLRMCASPDEAVVTAIELQRMYPEGFNISRYAHRYGFSNLEYPLHPDVPRTSVKFTDSVKYIDSIVNDLWQEEEGSPYEGHC